MNLLISILIATLLIVGMILFRMFAERYVLRSKLRKGTAGSECEKVGCFRGCEPGKEGSELQSVSGQNNSKRSAYHAP